MSKKIEITDITIKMGQKKVTLSPEEARELMEALEMLLGAPEPKVIERIIERNPWRYWYVTNPHYYGNITVGDTPTIPNWTADNSGTAGSYTLTLGDN